MPAQRLQRWHAAGHRRRSPEAERPARDAQVEPLREVRRQARRRGDDRRTRETKGGRRRSERDGDDQRRKGEAGVRRQPAWMNVEIELNAKSER